MTVEGRPGFRWGAVLKVAAPLALLATLAGGMLAVDPWLPFFPHELGQRLTERFFRVLLVGYLGVAVALPTLLVAAIWLLLRGRRRGRQRPLLARGALLLASGLVAHACLELAATSWLSWVHRLPRLPLTFPDANSEEPSLSLVVIGGSSALGYPYEPRLSVGQIVAWQLETAVPSRRVALDIRANLGKNLEEMHTGLAELKRRPDAMIIFSGHNEFLSRFETHRDAGYSETHEGAFLQRLYKLSLRSPFCLWVYETARKHRLGGPPPPVNTHRLIDAPSFTLSELQQLRDDFRRRLEAIVSYCERVGAVPILVIPPSNESGFEPNRTVFLLPPSPDRVDELTRAFRRARELEGRDPEAGIRAFSDLVSREPEFAEAHFRLGRLLERRGRYDEARVHYIAAKDRDGFPVRCRSDFAQIYHEVAARHGCILVDSPEVLRSRTRNGILDDSVFHDAHHPTFLGHLALAEAITERLHERKLLGLGLHGEPTPVVDVARCASRFGVDTTLWADACVKSGTYYKHLGSARFDPAEREVKQRRFLNAADELRAGRVRPDQSGIPGIGLAPDREFPLDWWNIDRAAH